MVNSQEIIERSVYSAILDALLKRGLTLNPEDYLPVSPANSLRYKADRASIESDKGFYVELYGSSNNLTKGEKATPRITINPQGFYPGEIGFESTLITEDDDGYVISEMPFESIDQFMDIRLISKSIAQSRELHSVLNSAIPQRGYIKPYTFDNKPFDGNIFIMISNYYNADNLDQGIIEKVYQFTIKDTLLSEIPDTEVIVPMTDISLILQNEATEINLNINN